MADQYCAFACARCGDCCRKHGLYPVTSSDVVDLSRHMGMEVSAFLDRYCTIAAIDGRHGLFVKGIDGACPFLDGAACSVHERKPLACSIFPDCDGYVTVRRLRDGMRSTTVGPNGLKRCAVWDLPEDAVLAPNIEATVRFRVREDTDRQYFAGHDSIDAETIGYLARLADLRSAHLPLCLAMSRKYGLLRQYCTEGLPDIVPLLQAERDILYCYCATYAAACTLPVKAIEPRGILATFIDGEPGIMVRCDELPPAGGEAHFLWRRYGEAGIFAAIVEGCGLGLSTAFVIHTPCLEDILHDGTLRLSFAEGEKRATFTCREGIL